MNFITTFKEKQPNLYEFIIFNVLSNVATFANFLVLWLSYSFVFIRFNDIPFEWFIFNYPIAVGGLGRFLSFVLAYIVGQIVNFIVQRKFVFHAQGSVAAVLPWYILTVVVAGLISIWLPPHIISLMQDLFGTGMPVVANIINILIQVGINYPMMKFVIMKK